MSVNELIFACFPGRFGVRPASSDRVRQVPWWTDQLSVARKRVRALRRRFQHCYIDDERRYRCEVFRRENARYKKLVMRAKLRSWRTFLGKITSETPLSDYRSLFKDSSDSSFNHKINITDSYFNSDNIRDLIAFHFPFSDTPSSRGSWYSCSTDPVWITYSEVRYTLKLFKPGKAPGPDGICLNVFKELFFINPQLLLDIFNGCLRHGFFPGCWKSARLVFLPKANKDPSEPSSYRPLCLLPILGKVFEKNLVNRLNSFVIQNNLINDLQFGFVQGRGTLDALDFVVDKVRSLRGDSHLALISYDIKNAFNSVRWTDIIDKLIEINVPPYLVNIYTSYFRDRTVCYSAPGVEVKKQYNIGVSQGAVSSPLFWNLIVDEIFRISLPSDTFLVAYADDILLISADPSFPGLENKCNRVTTSLTNWSNSHGLTFDHNKSSLLYFIKKGNKPGRNPLVRLLNNKIKVVRHFKYLGIVLDNNLNWTEHLREVHVKTQSLLCKLYRVSRATWGLGPSVAKKIYLSVVEKVTIYGSPIWWSPNAPVRLNNSLNKILRSALIFITKAYRTAPTQVLSVIAGILPIDLAASIECSLYMLKKGKCDLNLFGLTVSRDEIEVPNRHASGFNSDFPDIHVQEYNHNCHPCRIFTDGSKMNGRVGAGFVVCGQDDGVTYSASYRLNDNASVFQAELFAILEALNWLRDKNIGSFVLISDSRSALTVLANYPYYNPLTVQIYNNLSHFSPNNYKFLWTRAHVGTSGNEAADVMAKCGTELDNITHSVGLSYRCCRRELERRSLTVWQNRWTCLDSQNSALSLIPWVSRKRNWSDHFLTQFITGHGKFPAYYHRFLNKFPLCICGAASAGPLHYLVDCPELNNYRYNNLPRNLEEILLGNLLFNPVTRGKIRDLIRFVNIHADSLFL